jgi:hypothetical protein
VFTSSPPPVPVGAETFSSGKFTLLEGLQTSDGRRVVRDAGGVVYSISELL